MYIPSPYKNLNKDQIKAFIQENSFATLILNNSNKVVDIRDSETPDEMEKGPIVELSQIREKLARHIPFEVDVDSNHYNDGQNFKTLTGHMATHYPIYKCFNDGDEALLTFQGPHSYVSPTWYDNLEAATWNYISIHVYGTIEKLDTKESAKRTVDDLEKKVAAHPENKVYAGALEKAKSELTEICGDGTPHLKQLLKTQLYKYEKRFACDPMMSIARLEERYKYLKQFIGAFRIRINHFEVNVQAAYKLSQDQSPWSHENIMKELTKSGYPESIATAKEMKGK